jgi:hypothetical protein
MKLNTYDMVHINTRESQGYGEIEIYIYIYIYENEGECIKNNTKEESIREGELTT